MNKLNPKSPLTYNTLSLARELGISRMTLFRWRRAGKLPQPITQKGNEVLWDGPGIRHWMLTSLTLEEYLRKHGS